MKEFKAKKATEMAAAAAVQRRAGEGAMMGGEDRASTPVPLTHLEYMMNVGRVRDVALREAEEADRKVARREARGADGGGKRRKGARVREAPLDLMGDGGGARAGRAGVRRRLVRCGSDSDTSDEDMGEEGVCGDEGGGGTAVGEGGEGVKRGRSVRVVMDSDEGEEGMGDGGGSFRIMFCSNPSV